MMADLLDEETVSLIWACILVGLSKKRIERLRNTADRRCIFAGSKGGYVE
jgi:hypothetical protein